MKYHSPFSVIAISISVLLLFAGVALVAVFSIGMTSPTLIVADIIMDKLSSAPGPVSVSFDSIDRNLRDGVFINGLDISLEGEEVLTIDQVTVKMGLFSLIRYAVLGNGSLSVEGSNARIMIPDIEGGGGGSSGTSTSFEFPSFLEPYSISLELADTVISYSGTNLTESADLFLYLDGDERTIGLDAVIDEVIFSDGEFSARLDNTLLSAAIGDSVSVSVSLDSLEAGNDSFDITLSRPALVFSDGSLAASFSSASGKYEDAEFSLSSSSVSLADERIETVLTSLSLGYGEYSVYAGEIDAVGSKDELSIILSSVRAEDSVSRLLSGGRINILLDIPSRNVDITIPSVSSEVLSRFDSVLTLEGENLHFIASLADNWSLDADGDLFLRGEDSAMNGTSGSFEIDAGGTGSDVSFADIAITGIHLPSIEDEALLSLSYDGEGFSAVGSFGDYLRIRASYRNRLSVDLLASELPIYPFRPFAEEYLPVITNYIGTDTRLTGSVSLHLDENMTGPAAFAFTLSDMLFRGIPFSIAASLNGNATEDHLSISSLALTTDFVRASYDGRISYRTLLPEGRFVISATETGRELFVGTLTLTDDTEYAFSAEIPRFDNSWLRGYVNWSESGLISSAATLNSGGYYYPFAITVDFHDNTLSLDNEMLHISGSFGEEIEASIEADDFTLPVFSEEGGEPCTINGDISFLFSFSRQEFTIDSEDFLVSNIRGLPESPELIFSFHGWNDGIDFNEITFRGPGYPDLSGAMNINFKKPSLAVYLGDDAGDEHMMISVIRMDDGMFSGILRMDSFNLGRVGLEGLVSDVNLSARAGTWETLSFSGDINAYSTDMINRPQSLSAFLYIDSSVIEVRNLSYVGGNLSVISPEVSYSADSGRYTSSFTIDYLIEKPDRNYPVHSSFMLSAALPSGENLYEAAQKMIDDKFRGVSASLVMDTLDIDGRLVTGRRDLDVIYDGSVLDFSGSLVSGMADISSGIFDLSIDLSPIAAFSVDGSIGGDHDTSLHFDIDQFEISIADLSLDPSIVFYDPAPASGEIYAINDGMNWNLFGYLEAEEVAFDVFWLPNQRVVLHNPYFVIWDNTFSSLIDDCTVISLDDLSRTPARVTLDIPLGESLSMLSWDVNVYVEDGNWVGIRLPMASNNTDLWADVTGHVYVGSHTEGVVDLTGDVKASNVTLSIGMEPMPEWMLEATGETTADISILLTENARFLFPLGADPILRADVAENQRLRVVVERNGDMDITGSLDIRSGEFFYFQKNFYITEGNIGFRSGLMSQGGFDPVINLRARLRDFDSDGNDVDIYLILRNATLDNISPSFESSPSKPISEIMQILGQSILPTSVYGDLSVSSMVSLVTASMDILTRLGIVNTRSSNTTLESAIRNSLSLDTFSLHSNILENLIFDTVAYASSNISTDALSPMARYLNGTTLYLGKYLSPELYLEGMIHLAANPDQTERSHTFLADDLNLDIEISLEWDNPLAVFTFFIQPVNLTLYDVMDSFGFGVSKRIVW